MKHLTLGPPPWNYNPKFPTQAQIYAETLRDMRAAAAAAPPTTLRGKQAAVLEWMSILRSMLTDFGGIRSELMVDIQKCRRTVIERRMSPEWKSARLP